MPAAPLGRYPSINAPNASFQATLETSLEQPEARSLKSSLKAIWDQKQDEILNHGVRIQISRRICFAGMK
jgi:hypothetical protein